MRIFKCDPEKWECEDRRFESKLTPKGSPYQNGDTEKHRVCYEKHPTCEHQVCISSMREPTGPIQGDCVEDKKRQVRIKKRFPVTLHFGEENEKWYERNGGEHSGLERRIRKPEQEPCRNC